MSKYIYSMSASSNTFTSSRASLLRLKVDKNLPSKRIVVSKILISSNTEVQKLIVTTASTVASKSFPKSIIYSTSSESISVTA